MRGRDLASLGWACIAYQWIYVPGCIELHLEPWNLTTYGLVTIAAGAIIGAVRMTRE
jgi:hypothetical protein